MTTTTTARTVVEYLRDRGHYMIETNSVKEHYKCACPSCASKNFSIHVNQQLFMCWSCGFAGGGVNKAQELLGDNGTGASIGPVAQLAVKNAKTNKMAKTKREPRQGASRIELCDAKGIDLDYAISIGWEDWQYQGKPAVRMPYYDTEGALLGYRYRVGINKGTRIVSAKGARVMPYGLQRIRDFRAGNYVILQEGESDWAALDSSDFNAIGIPGVSTFQPEWTVYFNGIKTTFVWQESGGNPDRHGRTPGQQMVHRISTYMGPVWVIAAPPEAKDPCELKQVLGEGSFIDRMHELMENAVRYDANEVEAAANPPKASKVKSSESEDEEWEMPKAMGEQTWSRGTAFDTTCGCEKLHINARRTASNIGKPINLTTLIHRHNDLWAERNPKNAEFHPLYQQGVKLGIFCVFLENPNLSASQNRMVDMVAGSLGMVDLSGQPVAAYTAINDCGAGASMNCDIHGMAFSSTHKCYQGFCPNCGTDASSNAARVTLPGMEGDANYHHVVLATKTYLPENLDHWGPALGKAMDKWQNIIKKASHWKLGKHRFYSRAHATYYQREGDRYVALTHWKLMMHEPEEGYMAKTLERIRAEMGAEIVDERRWQAGTTATMQITADFMTHFVGIDDTISHADQCKIFLGHYLATKGRHIFQAFNLFREKIALLPVVEPQICPEPGCGLKLREVISPRPPDATHVHNKDGGGRRL